MKQIRKPLLVLCLAALLCGLLGTGAKATTQTVEYVDENGEPKTADCTVIDGSVWAYRNSGWYAVTGNVSADNDFNFICTGDVNLILCDGATLTVNGDFNANASGGRFTFYGQKNGTGTLRVGSETTNDYHYLYSSTDEMIVRGGVIEAATNGWTGAIHASHGLTVSGGSVTARSSDQYGIQVGGSLTVSGGSVTARGTGTGIEARDVAVSGGALDAEANNSVGSVNGLWAKSSIIITGGTVRAVQGEDSHNGGYGAYCNNDSDIILNWNDPDASVVFSTVGNPVDVKCRFTADGVEGVQDAGKFSAAWDANSFNGKYGGKTLRPFFVYHDLIVSDGIGHGTVTASTKRPFEGQTVTLTATPADGYKAADATVMCGGDKVPVTRVDATHYTFTMPNGDARRGRRQRHGEARGQQRQVGV